MMITSSHLVFEPPDSIALSLTLFRPRSDAVHKLASTIGQKLVSMTDHVEEQSRLLSFQRLDRFPLCESRLED